MKKSALLLMASLTLLATNTIWAQTKPVAAAKGTALNQRLVALTTSKLTNGSFVYSELDSTAYRWLGNGGFNYDPIAMKYRVTEYTAADEIDQNYLTPFSNPYNYKYDSILFYFRPSTSLPFEKRCQLIRFDNQNRFLSEQVYNWQSNSWFLQNDLNTSYNTQGKFADQSMRYHDSRQYVNSYREEVSYNTNQMPVLYQYFTWVAGAWVAQIKKEYSYDASTNTQTEIRSGFLSNAWLPMNKMIIKRNAADKIESIIKQDYSNGSWLNKLHFTYTRYANGRIQYFDLRSWSATNNAWGETQRWEVLFNSANKVSVANLLVYSGGAFVPARRDVYTYNSRGILTKLAMQQWNPASNSYALPFHIDTSVVDNDGYIKEQWAVERTVGDIYKPKTDKNHFHYRLEDDAPTSVPLVHREVLKAYPIPADGYLNITAQNEAISSYYITDIEGRMIFKSEAGLNAYAKTAISLAHLVNGTYFLHANTNNGDQTVRFNVQH